MLVQTMGLEEPLAVGCQIPVQQHIVWILGLFSTKRRTTSNLFSKTNVARDHFFHIVSTLPSSWGRKRSPFMKNIHSNFIQHKGQWAVNDKEACRVHRGNDRTLMSSVADSCASVIFQCLFQRSTLYPFTNSPIICSWSRVHSWAEQSSAGYIDCEWRQPGILNERTSWHEVNWNRYNLHFSWLCCQLRRSDCAQFNKGLHQLCC